MENIVRMPILGERFPELDTMTTFGKRNYLMITKGNGLFSSHTQVTSHQSVRLNLLLLMKKLKNLEK